MIYRKRDFYPFAADVTVIEAMMTTKKPHFQPYSHDGAVREREMDPQDPFSVTSTNRQEQQLFIFISKGTSSPPL